MSNFMDPDGFADKLYNRFPGIYIEDDKHNNYALKKYIQSAGQGFKVVINEINDLQDLIDPLKVPAKHLDSVFSSYGFDLFHGIPEPFLRNLLPLLGKLFARKGTFSSLEFITSTVAGVKTEATFTETGMNNCILNDSKCLLAESFYLSTIGKDIGGVSSYYSKGFVPDHSLLVVLNIDYDKIDSFFPNQEQLIRIAKEFLPFYCNLLIHYKIYYADTLKVNMHDFHVGDGFLTGHKDSVYIYNKDDEAHLDSAVENPHDENESTFMDERNENSCFLNNSHNLIGDNFYLSSITGYDTIWENGEKRIKFMNK